MTLFRRSLIVALLVTITGCMARVGSDLSVPPDAATTCDNQCRSIGLAMTAVAIMANNVGCVCQPVGPPRAASEAGANGATAGMVTIMMEDEMHRQTPPPP